MHPLRNWREDLDAIADALAVPLLWLVAVGVVGFAFLAAAGTFHSAAVGYVSAVFGGAFAIVGVRALFAPSRPFRLEPGRSVDYINTTRRVGGFYVLAGLVWILLSLAAPHGS